jgi:hypothetical protein
MWFFDTCELIFISVPMNYSIDYDVQHHLCILSRTSPIYFWVPHWNLKVNWMPSKGPPAFPQKPIHASGSWMRTSWCIFELPILTEWVMSQTVCCKACPDVDIWIRYSLTYLRLFSAVPTILTGSEEKVLPGLSNLFLSFHCRRAVTLHESVPTSSCFVLSECLPPSLAPPLSEPQIQDEVLCLSLRLAKLICETKIQLAHKTLSISFFYAIQKVLIFQKRI